MLTRFTWNCTLPHKVVCPLAEILRLKLIALTGIVGHQKAQFAMEIAVALQNAGQRVAVIDNGDHSTSLACPTVLMYRSIDGFDERIYNKIQRMACDVILLVVSESTHPESLMIALEHLQDLLPDLTTRLIALIDDRTCDCFPHLRLMLEDTADITLHAPFDVNQISGDL
jgi:hypothetical protein